MPEPAGVDGRCVLVAGATSTSGDAAVRALVAGGATAGLGLADIIDLAAERQRLTKAVADFDSDIGHVNKKLGNPNFVSRAAPEVVEEQRAKLAEAEAGKTKLQAALTRLEAL